MAQQPQGKRVWPELVGKSYEEAEAAIKADNPSLKIFRVLHTSPVTADYSPTRVRIAVDDAGVVVVPPGIG